MGKLLKLLIWKGMACFPTSTPPPPTPHPPYTHLIYALLRVNKIEIFNLFQLCSKQTLLSWPIYRLWTLQGNASPPPVFLVGYRKIRIHLLNYKYIVSHRSSHWKSSRRRDTVFLALLISCSMLTTALTLLLFVDSAQMLIHPQWTILSAFYGKWHHRDILKVH